MIGAGKFQSGKTFQGLPDAELLGARVDEEAGHAGV
jgi:hypothetical protein